jgi:AcrR family transcriptional regulator
LPIVGKASDTDCGGPRAREVLQAVTIGEAYRGLGDYLAEQEGAFDVSAGLMRLFAESDHPLPAVQSTVTPVHPAPESGSWSPRSIRTSRHPARTRSGVRVSEVEENAPVLVAGGTSVRTRPTRRTQQERSAAIQRRLLDATIDCLNKYGYAGTTTTRVTELAGVTRGAQMYHFPTRADLIAAAVRHLAGKRAELAFDKIDQVRQAPDRLDAGLELMWEIHQGPVTYASIEMWMAARTDPDLREQLTKVEPAARASLIEFAEAAFGDYAAVPRFRHVMYTAMDAIRGILVMGLSDDDSTYTLKRWRRAKADLRELMNAVLTR